MNAPLYEKIAHYCGKRFHMPSHNGEEIVPLFCSAKYDITELSFSDNLLYSKSVIQEAEQLAAQSYKVKHSRFFTSGATSALHTALLAIKALELMPIVVGECHASIYNGLNIFDIEYKSSSTINEEKLEHTQAVIITSPDVYGVTQNLKDIKNLIGNRLLIVDESHGAHFAFSSLLPESATAYADITINSMHKTLPCYTGGAILHTNSDYMDRKIVEFRRQIHTSSPSYLTMASMDWARAYFEKMGEELYKDIFEKINNLTLPKGYTIQKNNDFSRLVISTQGRGKEVYKALEKANIYAEMCDSDRVVFIVTPFNVKSLSDIVKVLSQDIKREAQNDIEKYKALIGQVAKSDIGLFPPCIPIIHKGEIIEINKLMRVIENLEYAYGLDL